MLLEEDRGSKGHRGRERRVGQGGVESRDVEGMGTEEFGDGVGERRQWERSEGGTWGARGRAECGERAAVCSRVCARRPARHQQLRRRMDRIGRVSHASGAGHHAAT